MTLVEPPSPAQGVPHPRAAGKFLFVGDRKLEVRGVTYGTFRPGPLDAPYPNPSVVRRDFREMAHAGFNAVRVYTSPPCWLMDEAMEAGLRVMAGLPWEQHVAFLDDAGVRRSVEARVRDGVLACKGHPALLGYAIGNEIPAPIVRWSGARRVEAHLERLYEAVKAQDPGVLVGYVNYPTTEYLELPFLDLVAFNVFIESTPAMAAYVARLQNIAGDRALLLTELGLDSRRHGLDAQARLVGEQIRAAREGGCAGAFVFAWTDEWHRGGWDVEDWDFGLTTRYRCPKPALSAARHEFSRPLAPAGGWPSITAVVCVHNGAPWIEDCLDGLASLRYPDYEVVVVDDGSTDGTAQLVERFDVRSIRTENRGLGHARNTGIEAARGDIVAFIDADARPDQDWLTQIALALASSEFAGVGGPNVAPTDAGRVASCVANAPGGPTHVLRTDREAEHIPGCNMAFRKSALRAVGGFDPVYRVAGDDVDICWRLQARGFVLGFAPGAMVWHHPRSSVRAFWRQQRGYGRAEALLEARWPDKYNGAGHVTWGGRVYGPPSVIYSGGRNRVYQGTWGEAPFQHLEGQAPGILDAAAMPEWYLLMLALAGLSVLGILWHPLLWAVPPLVAGTGASVVRAVRAASRAHFPGPPAGAFERIPRRALVALLHLTQPAARLAGRLMTGLVPWRPRARARSSAPPRERRFALWRERGESLSRTLRRVERNLRRGGSPVRRGGGYDGWDLHVDGGILGFARLRSCTEEHGQGKQLFRAEVRARISRSAVWLLLIGAGLTAWSAADGVWIVAGVLAAATLLISARAAWECASAAAVLVEAVTDAEEDRTSRRRARAMAPSGLRAPEARASLATSIRVG